MFNTKFCLACLTSTHNLCNGRKRNVVSLGIATHYKHPSFVHGSNHWYTLQTTAFNTIRGHLNNSANSGCMYDNIHTLLELKSVHSKTRQLRAVFKAWDCRWCCYYSIRVYILKMWHASLLKCLTKCGCVLVYASMLSFVYIQRGAFYCTRTEIGE